MTLHKCDEDEWVDKNDPRDWYIECDDCKDTLDIKKCTFLQMFAFAKAMDWHAYNSFGTWMHRCPECHEVSRLKED